MAKQKQNRSESTQAAQPANIKPSIRWLTMAELLGQLNKVPLPGTHLYDEWEILTYAKHYGLPVYRHRTVPVEGTVFREKVVSLEILRGQAPIPRERVVPEMITVGLIDAPPYFRQEDADAFNWSAMPRWISGKDLLTRWGVRLEDLKTHVRDFALPVYTLPEQTPMQQWDKVGLNAPICYVLAGERILIRFFRTEDVERFERHHNPCPNLSRKKLRPDQQARLACREAAKKLWDQNPQMTIAAVIETDEIVKASRKPKGGFYTPKTKRVWIKDLAPNRSSGRRSSK